jgi:hypothetical protein
VKSVLKIREIQDPTIIVGATIVPRNIAPIVEAAVLVGITIL